MLNTGTLLQLPRRAELQQGIIFPRVLMWTMTYPLVSFWSAMFSLNLRAKGDLKSSSSRIINSILVASFLFFSPHERYHYSMEHSFPWNIESTSQFPEHIRQPVPVSWYSRYKSSATPDLVQISILQVRKQRPRTHSQLR